MLYKINDATVSTGAQVILSHIDFEIKGRDKIAVVGRNGAGKTTLLKVISGEIELDRDDRRKTKEIETSSKLTISMLSQTNTLNHNITVNEFILENSTITDRFSREYFEYELEFDRIFTGFGFTINEKNKKIGEFSGGEQTKLFLIRLLLAKPDILLLDEPTNHLDIRTLEWLEDYLNSYDRAVVIVSHDRFFLDRVADVVYELSDGRLTKYSGNYTQYRMQKQKNLAIQKKEYEQQLKEIQRLDGLIEQFKNKPRKAAFARSRKTILDRMEKLAKPQEMSDIISINDIIPQELGSKWPLETDKLKIGYNSELLEMSIRIRRGQKIGVIGENGTGKSTFLKTVAGVIEPFKGTVTIGNQIKIGYFDQQTAEIMSDKTVLEHFRELFPAMTEKETRRILAMYLFTGADASKKVTQLSGGEKARLVLAEILNMKPNFLVLDEPTNHMDIQAKEVLEEAFRKYRGTILFVSHDRYFISQVADAILLFQDGQAQYYPFNYEHYIYRSRQEKSGIIPGMISAKDQALIEGLKAVPRSERHESRQLTNDEAYKDWKLQLLAEPLFKVQEDYEKCYNEYNWIIGNTETGEADLSAMRDELQDKWEKWHGACLSWYDNYLEEMFDTDSIESY
jgi:ATP-binding cassette subfamily F protein 3